MRQRELVLRVGPTGAIHGDLVVPDGTRGVVVFAHGSGSSRRSPRNQEVAAHLQRVGLATLLFDLLTEAEELADRDTGHLRFDIDLLAQRVELTVNAVLDDAETRALPVGLFGASTGAAAALVAAGRDPAPFAAVVSRGRPSRPRGGRARVGAGADVADRRRARPPGAGAQRGRRGAIPLRAPTCRGATCHPPLRGTGRGRGSRPPRGRLVPRSFRRRAGREPYADRVVTDRRAEGENGDADFELGADVEALVDDDEPVVDETRHYQQDPDHLAENARDADQQEQDEELELDQTELDELGLTLDDPHQPESE